MVPSLTHAPVLQVATSLQTFKWLIADVTPYLAAQVGLLHVVVVGGGRQVRWGGQRIRRQCLWRWQQVQLIGTKIALGVAGMMVAAGLVVLALGFGSGPMCVC